MFAKIFSLSAHIVIMCFLQDCVNAHLGEDCTIFDFCLNSFKMPITNAFCDSDKVCKCKEGFLSVGHHLCVLPQHYGGSCDHDNVCKYFDENSICDKSRGKVCECRKSYQYDKIKGKCILQVKKKPNSPSLFPITAVILIACVGIFCGCGIICHNFQRQPELSIHSDQIRRTARQLNPANLNPMRNANNTPNNQSNSESVNHPLQLRSESRTSSKFDSLLYDEPPPKYEDAIKDYPSEIIIDSQVNMLEVSKS